MGQGQRRGMSRGAALVHVPRKNTLMPLQPGKRCAGSTGAPVILPATTPVKQQWQKQPLWEPRGSGVSL